MFSRLMCGTRSVILSPFMDLKFSYQDLDETLRGAGGFGSTGGHGSLVNPLS